MEGRKMIEVGEYVRTKEGEIHKVIKIIEDDRDWDYYCCENNTGYFAMDIAKHNKQLIYLIEKDDYVNGSKVLAVMEDMETGELHLEMTSNYTNEEIGDCTIYEKEKKTILTKEQYEANCYKVGGEDQQRIS